MYYDFKGWWINNARELLSNYRNGAICVTYSKQDQDAIAKDLPRLVTNDDIDQYCYASFLYSTGRDNYKAYQIIQNLMYKNYTHAYYVYAHMLYDGKVVSKNEYEGARYFQKVIDAIPNFAPALYNLGVCYINGNGVSKNETKGIQMIQKAKELGLNNAINYIGHCYYNGKLGFPKDPYKAFECYNESSFRGDTTGYFNLGILYSLGAGCTQDKKKAYSNYSLAATKGHLEAQYISGIMCLTGTDIPRNLDGAVYFFEMAAKAGQAKSMGYLGSLLLSKELCYYMREEEGKEWIRKGARLGDKVSIEIANKYNIRY